VIKDLIYHCCPLRDNDLWLRNVEQLLARIHIFDGRKIIAVACLDDKLLPIEHVQSAFAGVDRIQFMRVTNDRNLRETASFRLLLNQICDKPWKNRAVFYAHTKGNSTYDSVEGATYWRNAMYHRLLDNWQQCIELLEIDAAAVGTTFMGWQAGAKSPYPSRLMHGNWMFAGTFFWFSAERVFSHPNWTDIPRDRYGTEAWLSGLFHHDEVRSVFQPWPRNTYPLPNPYEPQLYARANMCIADCELFSPSYQI